MAKKSTKVKSTTKSKAKKTAVKMKDLESKKNVKGGVKRNFMPCA